MSATENTIATSGPPRPLNRMRHLLGEVARLNREIAAQAVLLRIDYEAMEWQYAALDAARLEQEYETRAIDAALLQRRLLMGEIGSAAGHREPPLDELECP